MSRPWKLESGRGLKTLARGVREVARIGALGLRKATILYERSGEVTVTRDSRAFAMEYRPRDSRRLGVGLVRESILRGEERWGKGGERIPIVADLLIRAGSRYPSPRTDLVRELLSRNGEIREEILSRSVPATEGHLRFLGADWGDGDNEVTDALIRALYYAGETGTVNLSTCEGIGVEIENRRGLVLPEKPASEKFLYGVAAGEPRVVEGPFVVVTDEILTRWESIAGVLEEATAWPGREVVVFCSGIAGAALAGMVRNSVEGTLRSVAFTYGGTLRGGVDWFRSIAAISDATFVSIHSGLRLSEFRPEMFGALRRVTIGPGDRGTELVPYEEERFETSTVRFLSELDARATVTDSDGERDRLLALRAALDGGYVRVKIGGMTESEARVRRGEAERLLTSFRSALRGGVILAPRETLEEVAAKLPDSEGGRVLAEALRGVALTYPEGENPTPAEAVAGAIELGTSLGGTILSVGAILGKAP